MPIYKVPNYRQLFEGGAEAGWSAKHASGQQSLIPREPLHEKLGIGPGSRVLFFAGGDGDWAHQLAQTTRVHYTDVSPSMVAHARKKFTGKGIEKFSTADAIRRPSSRNYDYLVSFEPVPLFGRIPLVLLRALAKTRGLRIIDGNLMEKKQLKIYQKVGNLYGASSGITTPQISIDTPVFLKEKTSPPTVKYGVTILEVDSNPQAQEKAKIDLAVILALQRHEKISVGKLRKKLTRKGFKIDRLMLQQSLNRIHALSEHMAEGISHRKVTLF